jgi:hypothetical protein
MGTLSLLQELCILSIQQVLYVVFTSTRICVLSIQQVLYVVFTTTSSVCCLYNKFCMLSLLQESVCCLYIKFCILSSLQQESMLSLQQEGLYVILNTIICMLSSLQQFFYVVFSTTSSLFCLHSKNMYVLFKKWCTDVEFTSRSSYSRYVQPLKPSYIYCWYMYVQPLKPNYILFYLQSCHMYDVLTSFSS